SGDLEEEAGTHALAEDAVEDVDDVAVAIHVGRGVHPKDDVRLFRLLRLEQDMWLQPIPNRWEEGRRRGAVAARLEVRLDQADCLLMRERAGNRHHQGAEQVVLL